MKILTRNIKRLIRLLIALSKINWILLFRNYSRKEGIVVMIPGVFYNYFRNGLEIDILNIAALLKNKQRVCVYIGKNFNKFKNRKICYSPSDLWNNNIGMCDAESIAFQVEEAEKNGNRCFYSSHDIRYWENKDFMHLEFERLQIKTPATLIVDLDNINSVKEFSFPCLVKELHSYASLGLHKCNSYNDFVTLIQKPEFRQKHKRVLVQQLLNIRKDLRVILIGETIVLHYWRVNLSKEWKPTSTSHGSGVDFVTFPDKWRQHIIDTFKKLNLVTGAFDITWQNDDISTEPYFLEVSPSYQPNPPVDLRNEDFNYGEFKKRLSLRKSWDNYYLRTILEIRTKVYAEWLRTF